MVDPHTLCPFVFRPEVGKSSNCHNNNDSNNSNNNKQPHDATKFVIPNAFYNRTEIIKVAKMQ